MVHLTAMVKVLYHTLPLFVEGFQSKFLHLMAGDKGTGAELQQ
jgi:hypothetical protein